VQQNERTAGSSRRQETAAGRNAAASAENAEAGRKGNGGKRQRRNGRKCRKTKSLAETVAAGRNRTAGTQTCRQENPESADLGGIAGRQNGSRNGRKRQAAGRNAEQRKRRQACRKTQATQAGRQAGTAGRTAGTVRGRKTVAGSAPERNAGAGRQKRKREAGRVHP